ncbi:uncharacterized protein PV09_03829 [Verruconis gallopava]|uniref:Oxidoreductase AflY n=1 Tax=Verruconis gallopava TaxID=253628 RepID=A0A0D2B1V1_9PEZI|nr:uncharacterized protein PV09_03829 [Verruconis gallopava]KIW05304.1 hypothetical protein PV09_03829 [Verruconis gallopava]
MATTSLIQLSPDHIGLIQTPCKADGSFEVASRILQKNHDENHMFWREVAGHNHITHSVLNVFALGGTPEDLQRAFDDGIDIQRPQPPTDPAIVVSLSNPDQFLERMGDLDQYSNFLAFFSREIEEKGWVAVVQDHVFGRSPTAEKMFAQLFEGLYHPLIHLGLGIEFAQPGIVAEGLAQAASHDSMGTEDYFLQAEREASISKNSSKPLIKLLKAVHDNQDLRAAPFGFATGPERVRNGILSPKNQSLLVDIAAQFRVAPEDLNQGLAETINSAAYMTGAAQRPGKARKLDFFHLHTLTASIALTVFSKLDWISQEDKVRLVEWKGRLDLVWYAASGAVELRLDDITNYTPDRSAGYDWETLFKAVLKTHDDGHLIKAVRALKNGEEYSKTVNTDDEEVFPVRNNSWFKIAQMVYDSTVDRDIMEKWIWGVGFDEGWEHVPNL